MMAMVQVTHPNTTVSFFEADTAKPDKEVSQEATPYQIVMEALIRRDMWHWSGDSGEDMDSQTAWARGPHKRCWTYIEHYENW